MAVMRVTDQADCWHSSEATRAGLERHLFPRGCPRGPQRSAQTRALSLPLSRTRSPHCVTTCPVPTVRLDKVSSWWDNLPYPFHSPGQGLFMAGLPARPLLLSRTRSPRGGTTCHGMRDLPGETWPGMCSHYGYLRIYYGCLNYWHELKAPKIHQKDSLNISASWCKLCSLKHFVFDVTAGWTHKSGIGTVL